MQIVRLSDGLGNQLFQYAFALALAEAKGVEVRLDLTWFPEFGGRLRKAVRRPYGLGVYPLSLPPATPQQVRRAMYGGGLAGVLRFLFHRKSGVLKECDFTGFDSLTDNRLLRGFWQQAAFAESVRPRLLRELTLPESAVNEANRALLAEIDACGEHAVCVHIRRGDYVREDSQKVHGLYSVDYYRRAETYLAERLGHPLHLFLFSDDPDWVRENYRSDFPITHVCVNPPNAPQADINLMRHCRHAIIANSTFSWWGAWLIEHPERIVIAPSQWRADGTDTTGLLPGNWVRM